MTASWLTFHWINLNQKLAGLTPKIISMDTTHSYNFLTVSAIKTFKKSCLSLRVLVDQVVKFLVSKL